MLLNHTHLPLHVLHNEGVRPTTMLFGAVPHRLLHGPRAQVHPYKLDVIKSSVRSPRMQRHYESMYTKFEAWRLPCRQVAYVDYDVLTLRSPDRIFDECGYAPFCAVQGGRSDQRYFSGGVFVMRPDNRSFSAFMTALHSDELHGISHEYAEQDLLNEMYPDWKALPTHYNVQGVGAGRSWDENATVWMHEKYWKLPAATAHKLHIPEGLPSPTWFDHVWQFLAHFW